MVPWEKRYLEGSEGVSKETYIARKMSENSDKHAFKFTNNFLSICHRTRKIIQKHLFFQIIQNSWTSIHGKINSCGQVLMSENVTKFKFLRILTGKNTLKLNSSAYEKYEYWHLGRWCIKLTLFKRFWNCIKFSKKI